MAGKFMSKMMDIIGLEEEYEEEEEFYEDEYEEPQAPKARREKNRYQEEEPVYKPELRPRASVQREREFIQEKPIRREEPVPIHDRKRRNRAVENMGGAQDVKLVVYRPHSYNDSQNIIDNLISNKPIIVNLDDLENDVAQRVLDFMSGAAYAQGGSVMKVSRGIFLLAPNNVDVLGNLEEDMRTNDFFNLHTANE